MQAAEDVGSIRQENQNPTDAIAELLVGEAEVESTDDSDSSVEVEAEQVEESPEVTEESEDQVEEQEASEESDEEEEDVTWSGVLGVDDHNIVVDENGDFSGVNVKVDGQVSTVKIGDLIQGYQTNKHNTQKSQALAAQQKEFEETSAKTLSEYNEKLEVVGTIADHLKNSFTANYANIDWNRLRQEDPAEYAAAIQDYNAQVAKYDELIAAVDSEKQANDEKATKEQQDKMGQYMQEQANILSQAFPEWQKPEVAQTAFQEMGEFANSEYGISPEEFSYLVDARHIKILNDAMSFRKGKKTAEQKKTMKKNPKFQKSTGRTSRKVSKLDKLVSASKKATGSKKRDLQSSAIATLLLEK